MIRVFLGGTCNDSEWREKLISMLDKELVSCFNPVVKDWNEACKEEEIRQRAICEYCLYVVTPLMEGFYSIAEMVYDSIKRKDRCLVCFLLEDKGKEFTDKQKHSILSVKKLVSSCGGNVFESLAEIACFLNHKHIGGSHLDN